MNTLELLNITSVIVPDRAAIVFEKKRITYAQLRERVTKLAHALLGMGVGSGDRVASMQVNCNEQIEAYFAAASLDAVYVPINFRSTVEEIAYMVKDCGPKVILAGERYVEMIEDVLSKSSSEINLIILDGMRDGWTEYESLLEVEPGEQLYPLGGGDELTMLMFTAGTTGSPKAVMLTHESFTSYILSNVSPAELDIEEKNILAVPLYHIAGVQAVMAAIYGGRTLIIQKQFEPSEWMRLVEDEGATRAMMVPTMLKMLMDHADFVKRDLSSLEVITYGAAPMPLEVIRRAIRSFPGTYFINAFGQTETAATITMLAPEDHIMEGDEQQLERKLKRLTSIGKPLVDVEVHIVDEKGERVGVGEIGEIVAHGPRLMKGYWNQEEATKQTLRDGWLYTGDLGYCDKDGYIFLSGRAKDFIKRGGEMVSPEEVEQVLHSHPSVEEAAIIGVDDPDWGERIRAIIVPKIGSQVDEEEIIEHCRSRLSSFKKPESVVFIEYLPRNAMGKVLKRELKQKYYHPIG
jgi:acyl-CoA synthetase (AMP-forming)/AMP-acid ligase II